MRDLHATLGAAALVAVWLVLPAPAIGQTTATETVIRVRASEPEPGSEPSLTPGPATVGTLAEAIARSRALRQLGKVRGPIVIALQPGTHRLEAPVRLTAEDSGTIKSPLVIRGDGPSARVTGSRRMAETPLPATLRTRFPPASQAHLKAYALPDFAAAPARVDIARRHDLPTPPVPFEVFDGQGALRASRWPNQGWTTAGNPFEGGTTFASPALALRMDGWKAERDVWIGAYFRWDWSYETRPLLAWQAAKGTAALERPPHYGFAKAFRAVVYHAAAELDQAGEWYRDREQKLLIAWPRDGEPALEVSQAEHLLVIEGASHVRVANLALLRSRGDAIWVADSRFVEIVGVSIQWTGGRAVTFTGSHNSGIRSSLIEDTGEGGVLLSGGDRSRLEPARLYVADSQIRRFSRLGLTYRPAVTLRGVGHHVEGNAISDAPHMAIEFRGNDHVIELNEIFNVATDTTDVGAVYTGRDWTAQGTVLRNNFLHDIRAAPGFDVKGIYLDDFASGSTIEGNVFLRVDQPVFVGGGRDNRVHNNIFVAASPAIYLDGRGLNWAAEHIHKTDGELRTQLAAMPVTSPRWLARYPELSRVLDDEPASPKRNAASGNLVVGGAAYQLLPEVNAAAQSLAGYDSGATQSARTPAGAETASGAKTAAALRVILATPVSEAGLSSLPLERMDRRSILPRVPGMPR